MGSVLCCFGVHGEDEHADQSAGVHRYCICLRCLSDQFVGAYTLLFQRGRPHAVPSSTQRRGPSESTSLIVDSSIPDTYRPPPRPLAYDDPRCSRLRQHRTRLGSTHGKASSHCHEESEPLRSSDNNSDIESLGTTEKSNGSDRGAASKLCHPEPSHDQSKIWTSGVTYFFSSSEDEDVCPTCLEEYTSENPKITMQCSHHFHLGCIYEWMERSEACPVCGKISGFNHNYIEPLLILGIVNVVEEVVVGTSKSWPKVTQLLVLDNGTQPQALIFTD